VAFFIEIGGEKVAARRDPLDSLWHLSAAASVTAGLLGLLAATLFVAIIFPQKPIGLAGAAAEQWLTAAANDFRGPGALLRGLGVFAVLDGLWLRFLLAALAYHLLVRLSIVIPESGRSAGRLRAGPAGAITACLGVLAALVGLLVNDAGGWRAAGMALTPGTAVPLPQAPGLRLNLESLAGAEPQVVSSVVISRSVGSAHSLQVQSGRPARSGSLWLIQRATDVALEVEAQDRQGRPLRLQSLLTGGETGPEIHVLFRPNQPEQAFAAASRNLSFRVISYPALPEQGIVRPLFLAEAYRGEETTPFISQQFEDQAELVVDGDLFTLRRDRYAILEVLHLPGLAVLLAGGLLTLIGLGLLLGGRFAVRAR
jgi:hypothetical protein